MKVMAFATVSALIIASAAIAQEKNPWPNWTKDEAQKILNHSPWAQMQTDTDVSEMVYSPTSAGRSSVGQPTTGRGTVGDQQSINNNRADRGAANQAITVNYQIRFLSARPIRQALARMIELEKKDSSDLKAGLRDFVDRDFSPYIVVAVTVDSSDRRFSGPIMQVLASATAGTLS